LERNRKYHKKKKERKKKKKEEQYRYDRKDIRDLPRYLLRTNDNLALALACAWREIGNIVRKDQDKRRRSQKKEKINLKSSQVLTMC